MRNRETAGTVDNAVILADIVRLSLAVLILKLICMRVLVNVALAYSVCEGDLPEVQSELSVER